MSKGILLSEHPPESGYLPASSIQVSLTPLRFRSASSRGPEALQVPVHHSPPLPYGSYNRLPAPGPVFLSFHPLSGVSPRLQHVVQLLRILRQSCIKDHRLGMAVIQRTGARSLALCQQAFRITIRDRQHRHKIPGFQLLGGAAGESQQNPARDKPRCSQMPSIIQSPDFLCPLFCSFPHETAPFLSVFLPIHRTITRNATLTGTATKLFQIT